MRIFSMNSFDSFTLAPMSAGDIIDRAVRIYRRNFLALLRIVIAPSLVAYAGSILVSIGLSNATLSKGDERIIFTVLMILSGSVLWVIGKAAFYFVLGGSSRSLVAHFFEGKPILARDVYRAVRERVWSLIGATLMVGLMMVGVMMIAYFFIIIIVTIFWVMFAAMSATTPAWAQAAVTVSAAIVTAVLLALAALLVYSRIVYVPQILMVEGKGVFNSIGRSFSLASGQILRLTALFLFWIYVSWSVLLLLFLPLGYISDWTTPFNTEQPAWYDIAWQTVTQLSEILLMPIFMIGCTLLYLDSRVRKEGFDVELVANRTLAQPPAPPPLYPTAPEWAAPEWAAPEWAPAPEWTPAPRGRGSFSYSILGLDDYIPAPIDPAPAQGAQFAPEVARKICDWCGGETDVENRFCSICGSAFDHRRGAEGVGDPSIDHQRGAGSADELSIEQRYGTGKVSDPGMDQRRGTGSAGELSIEQRYGTGSVSDPGFDRETS